MYVAKNSEGAPSNKVAIYIPIPKMAVAFVDIFMDKVETEILNRIKAYKNRTFGNAI